MITTFTSVFRVRLERGRFREVLSPKISGDHREASVFHSYILPRRVEWKQGPKVGARERAMPAMQGKRIKITVDPVWRPLFVSGCLSFFRRAGNSQLTRSRTRLARTYILGYTCIPKLSNPFIKKLFLLEYIGNLLFRVEMKFFLKNFNSIRACKLLYI